GRFMLRVRTALLVLLLLLLAESRGSAALILTATLTNSQENPPTVPTLSDGVTPRPASFGEATFVLDQDAPVPFMTFTATIFNIDVTGTQTADPNDNIILAHTPAPAPPGTNTGVVWGFFGSPFNDNMPNDFSFTPFATGVGGTFSGKWDLPEGNGTTLAAQIPNILAGLAYINFHTTQF